MLILCICGWGCGGVYTHLFSDSSHQPLTPLTKQPLLSPQTQTQNVRLALIEALRLYPEPPILIRRALEEDQLPAGGSGLEGGVRLLKGTGGCGGLGLGFVGMYISLCSVWLVIWAV